MEVERRGKKTSDGSHKYGQWQELNLRTAVRAVKMYNWSTKKAAETHGIPRSTLQRYLKQCCIDGAVEKQTMGRRCTMSAEHEDELSALLQEMESRLYGLSPVELRKIVYQFCVLNKLAHNFDTEKKCAGRKWLKNFLARHPELSVRKAEGVSLQRACGYNISKVRIFEQLLKNELFTEDGARKIPVENIFNVDETGITVNQKPKRILAKKGKKSVGVVTSVEKGKTITAVCCVSAAGAYCPPFLIFPRKRFKAELLDGGPAGAIGVANESGWINEDAFLQWFEHFLKVFQPQHRSCPSLLIMDGHASHTNSLQLVMRARENNVNVIILPSHTTHKMQPLDVAVFKSLKSHYDKAVDSWLREHPGRGVQEANVAALFAEAWGKAATVGNAISGFRKSRIEPFREVDNDADEFLAADVTDVPQSITNTGSLLHDNVVTPASTSVNVAATESESIAAVNDVVTPASTSVNVAAENSVVADSLANAATPLRSLIMIPKRVRVVRSKREVAHAKIITSSPYKRKLENAAEEKKKKADAKIKRSERLAEKKAKKAESKVNKPEPKRKHTEKSAAGSNKKKKNGKKSDEVNVEDDDPNCLYCEELYSTSSEAWIKCQGPCRKWSHLSCAGLTAADKHFMCEICQEL